MNKSHQFKFEAKKNVHDLFRSYESMISCISIKPMQLHISLLLMDHMFVHSVPCVVAGLAMLLLLVMGPSREPKLNENHNINTMK